MDWNSPFAPVESRFDSNIKFSGLGDTGFTGNDYMRCEAVKDMARQASHVIIVTESNKFHQKGVSNLIDLHQVSCIYTDQGIPQEVEEYFKEKHIQDEKVWS